MPLYDCTLRDFLNYIATHKNGIDAEAFFPIVERIQMTKRILDGLLYINNMIGRAHRDLKLRQVFKNCFRIGNIDSTH